MRIPNRFHAVVLGLTGAVLWMLVASMFRVHESPPPLSFCVDKVSNTYKRLVAHKHGAFIEITPLELLLIRARELDRLPPGRQGKLHCQTVAVKDNIETSTSLWGLHTTAGSQVLLDLLTGDVAKSAPAVERLELEGCVVVGKANMDDFALSYHTYSTRSGQTENALTRGRYPGGSSGGSAVAVALGLVDFALGTDTGGSIRIPSAFSGVCGLRPSQGRISTVGVVPLSHSRDTVGPIARTVSGVQRAFEVLVNKPCPAVSNTADRTFRIGILADYFEGRPEYAKAVSVLQVKMRAKLVKDYAVDLSLASIKRQSKSASMYEFQSQLEAYLSARQPSSSHAITLKEIVIKTRQVCETKIDLACDFVVDSLTKKQSTAALQVPPSLTSKWRSMSAQMKELMQDYDAVVIPSVSVQPTKLATGKQTFCANNRLASITGLAALSVKSIEFIGTDECQLFALARLFE
ncbi:hypothetical protein BASA81_007312 [Batrachochytrium salamandrivorans]|nr:hypothetical protein BASA81_007312 [Batrachochytrium salamandrivorans]